MIVWRKETIRTRFESATCGKQTACERDLQCGAPRRCGAKSAWCCGPRLSVRLLNLLFGLAHLLQAVVLVVLSEDVDVDVTAMFASGPPGRSG